MDGIEAQRVDGRRERSVVTMLCGNFHPSGVKEGKSAGSRVQVFEVGKRTRDKITAPEARRK